MIVVFPTAPEILVVAHVLQLPCRSHEFPDTRTRGGGAGCYQQGEIMVIRWVGILVSRVLCQADKTTDERSALSDQDISVSFRL